MNYSVYINPINSEADQFRWLICSETQSLQNGQGSLTDLHAALSGDRNRLTLIAPAEKLALHRVNYEASERRHLAKTIPYSLEEKLAEDIDDLHFALDTPSDNQVSVVVIEQGLLADWIALFEAEGLELNAVVPELSLLPQTENAVSILIDAERWLVRYQQHAFAMSAEEATFALQLLLNEAEPLPDVVAVFGPAHLQAAVTAQLPELLKDKVSWLEQNYWQTLAVQKLSAKHASAPVNLLQGKFARSLPLKKIADYWRAALVLLAVALLLDLGRDVWNHQKLEAENLALRQHIEKTYRQAIPRGNIVDPEAQLRRKLASLKGGGGDAGFVTQLAQVGQAIKQVNGVELQALNYSERNKEVRLTLIANQFKDVESLRAAIAKTGLKAELAGSSAEGDKTRARLKISS